MGHEERRPGPALAATCRASAAALVSRAVGSARARCGSSTSCRCSSSPRSSPAPCRRRWSSAPRRSSRCCRTRPPGIIGQEFCERFVFFLVGYYAAGRIFAFAAWVEAHRGAALAGLAVWALANGGLVALGVAAWPGIGLALGLAGAIAVIAVAVLLSRYDAMAPLRYCGRNSLVIYLAFFIAMASLRTILLRTAIIEDLGTISLIVTAVAVVTPLMLHRAVRGTALRVLFERPAWARLGEPVRGPALVPAE